jgi:hypothetical protein
MMLRKMFGHEREQVTEHWRILPKNKSHKLYISPDIMREMRNIQNSGERPYR